MTKAGGWGETRLLDVEERMGSEETVEPGGGAQAARRSATRRRAAHRKDDAVGEYVH